MMHMLLTRLLATIFCVCLITYGGTAEARNLPGSAASVMPEFTRAATNMIVREIKRDVIQMRNAAPTVGVTRNAGDQITSFAFSGGRNGIPASASLAYRSLDIDDLDGGIFTGNVLVGFQTSETVMMFGGLVSERVDVVTKFNAGTLKNSGFGIVLGVDYAPTPQLHITGLIGVMKLDYDVTRNGGVDFGSFSANRKFIELNADYLISNGASDLRLDAGLLYMSQSNDGYIENTGGVAAPFKESQLLASFGLRNEWGAAGQMRPYLEVNAWVNLSDNNNAVPVLGLIENDDWAARIGAGVVRVNENSSFGIGIGANFGEDGFEGPDVRIRYAIKF